MTRPAVNFVAGLAMLVGIGAALVGWEGLAGACAVVLLLCALGGGS